MKSQAERGPWRDRHQCGQGLVEYSLSILFIAIAVVVALSAFEGGLSGLYQNILTAVVHAL